MIEKKIILCERKKNEELDHAVLNTSLFFFFFLKSK